MLLKDIWLDVKAVQERDPAARNALEVLILYQGVHALIWHRIAHWFWIHNMRFLGRLISQIARFFTLIEIHPGAVLGHGILIDHGCGMRSYLYGLQTLSVSQGQTVEKGQAVGALGEELTMDYKLGSKSVNPWLLFQTSGGLFWKENG